MISIIVPTYNESKNLLELMTRIKRVLYEPYEIIIVDDGSPDGTGDLAQQLSAQFPIKLIQRGGKKGLASAVLDGYAQAKGDLWCVMDSDLSHPPEVIPLLIRNLREQQADIVIGSRFVKGGEIENWPKERLMGTNTAMLSVRILTPIKDPMAGFYLLRKEVVQGVNLSPRGYKILLEILVKGRYSKAVEIPITFKDRVYGQSKLNLKVYLEFMIQLGDLYCYKLTKIFNSRR